MSKNRKIIRLTIIIAVFLLVIFTLYGITDKDPETVTIGYLPTDHDAALFVANATGMFKKAGLEVELHEYNNGGDLMSAMASGDLDVGYVGITPAIYSISKEVPIKIVAGAQNEGSGLLSHDSSVKSITDLKGKTVATPGEASVQSVLLKYDLKKNGLNTSDIESPAMKVSSMNDALRSEGIDAMLTYEPYVTISKEINNQTLVKSSEDILPDHPCCVVVMNEKFLSKHPDKARKILDIHKKATDMIKANPEEMVQYLPPHIVPNAEIEKESLKHIEWVTGLNDTYKKNVINFLNIERDLGILEDPVPQEELFIKI
ncbi:ABC transporter substrate-binding protein [Methanobrevibacter sp.]|uniref:ABC transporter substrate-binding protein n=1 Tax=Methanobrevibacter sp. TaxID=66852 RepID=UPI0026E0D0A8|nr:ABC transporter substrate-binding protein [Methanobrevibacter sp.]MDO5860578.1 ABC transporter substrate-binding protein [Methanobrevibacter sp.]